MGLRILHGGIGSGRTRKCLEEIEALGRAYPQRRAMLIVPDPLKLDTEAFLMGATGRNGLMMAEVLSFPRLAQRALGETGGLAVRYADASGRSMAVHRVLKARRGELSVFGPMADRPGFVPQIEAVLSEFRRYGVRPEDLERTPGAGAEDLSPVSFRNKANDFAKILRDYECALERLGLLDPGGDLDRLAEILGRVSAGESWPYDRLSWLRSTSVWIDGFGERRDFTPQETRVIEALTDVCEEVTVTLCTDLVPADAAAAEDGPDALAIGRRTAYRLNRRLAARLVPGGILPLAVPGRGRHPELLHLGHSLERGLTVPYEGPADAVVAYRALDVYEETAWVAGEIRRLVFQEGLRFKDVAVAACSFEAYAPLLESAFDTYGIFSFLDREVRLSGSALPRFVLTFLGIADASWTLESVMACLRTGLADISPDEADRLENFFLKRGIRGRSRIFDDRRYADRFDADPTAAAEDEPGDGPASTATEDGATVLRIRDRSLSPLRDALDAVRAAKTCGARCAALATFLDGYGMHDRVYRLARDLRGKGASDGAMRLVKSWNALCSVLIQMVDVAGEEEIPLEDFIPLLAAGIDACRAGTIPASPDAVLAGPPDRVIARRPAVLFVIGATSDALPQKGVSEGLLSAADRDRLVHEGGLDLPSGVADKPFEDAFREYSLLSLPTERLYVGFAETDRKGANVDPSTTWTRVVSLLPGCRRVTVGPMRRAEPDDPRRLAVKRSATSSPVDAAEGSLAGPAPTRDVRLPPGLVAGAFGSVRGMSVSQLETYAACPYAYFCKYVLRLAPREVWKPEAANTGSLAHGVVEQAMGELARSIDAAIRDGRNPDDEIQAFVDSDLERKVDGLIRSTALRDRLGLFLDEGIRTSAGRKVRGVASASLRAAARQLLGQLLRPALQEWAFGPEDSNPLVVELADGSRVHFRGRVDRVDARSEGDREYYRIVDYKTGDKKVDYQALYAGLAFQLPAYLAAYRNGVPSRVPVDAAYFHLGVPLDRAECAAQAPALASLHDRESGYYKLRALDLAPDALELAVSHSRALLRETCGDLFGGRFDVRPLKAGSGSPCEWCDYRSVCRKSGPTDCPSAKPLPSASAAGTTKKRDRYVSALAKDRDGRSGT